VETDTRTREVLQWILNGAPRYEVLRLASEKYNISERQVENYITKAHTLLRESHERGQDHAVSVAVAQRQSLYALALESGDYRLGLNVLADLAKLVGIYAPTKTDITTKGERLPLGFIQFGETAESLPPSEDSSNGETVH